MSIPRPNRHLASAIRGRPSLHSKSNVHAAATADSVTGPLSDNESEDDDVYQLGSFEKSQDGPTKDVHSRRTQSPGPAPTIRRERSFDGDISPRISSATHESRREEILLTKSRTLSPASPKAARQTASERTLSPQAQRFRREIETKAIIGHLSSSTSGKSHQSFIGILPIGFIIILLAICAAVVVMKEEEVAPRKFCNGLDSLKQTFPNQEPYLWRALKSGIEGVLNDRPPSPSIFLFLHHNDNSTRKIVSEIVKTAAGCFDPNLEAVTLASKDFSIDDIGIIIQRYREALKSGGVALIVDLNKIPPEAARALHFICDAESPIINNVVLFLTLTPLSDDGKPIEAAEDTLNSIWSSTIEENTLAALIARVTDQVIRLHPEEIYRHV